MSLKRLEEREELTWQCSNIAAFMTIFLVMFFSFLSAQKLLFIQTEDGLIDILIYSFFVNTPTVTYISVFRSQICSTHYVLD